MRGAISTAAPFRVLEYFRGPGVYVKSVKVDESLNQKRYFLRFEGANTVTRVQVNSQLVGSHTGGYAAFVFEITGAIRFGVENEIRVEVDNSPSEDIMPLSGDFNIYGGLYRPVQLLVTEAVCITPLDHGGPGVYIRQEQVSEDEARVKATIKLSNGTGAERDLNVEVTIRDAGDTEVASSKRTISVAPGESVVEIGGLTVRDPHLWNGLEDPYLYSVEALVSDQSQVLDSVLQPLGLRYFELDPDQGFFFQSKSWKRLLTRSAFFVSLLLSLILIGLSVFVSQFGASLFDYSVL